MDLQYWMAYKENGVPQWSWAKNSPQEQRNPFFRRSHPSDAVSLPVVALWFAQLDGK